MKFVLTFDELFKLKCKEFFTFFRYSVETDFEIFKLPKKLDVLVVRSGRRTGVPPEFKILTHWKSHNMISYKSLGDRVRLKDIFNMIVYFFGYVNLVREATLENASATLIVSHRPAGFLKKYRRFVEEVLPGKYRVNLNLCQIYIIDLNAIPPDGYDAEFLMNYARAERLEEVQRFLEKKHGRERRKLIDILRELLYVRLRNFESVDLREELMATKMVADITDMVKPYYDKGLDKGKREGKREGKLETARNMLAEGMELKLVKKITGLTEKQLRAAGLLAR